MRLGSAVRTNFGDDSTNANIQSSVSGACQKETKTKGGPSLDGTCGPNFPNDRTCTGSAVTKFGACCSNFGFCGNETAHCKFHDLHICALD